MGSAVIAYRNMSKSENQRPTVHCPLENPHSLEPSVLDLSLSSAAILAWSLTFSFCLDFCFFSLARQSFGWCQQYFFRALHQYQGSLSLDTYLNLSISCSGGSLVIQSGRSFLSFFASPPDLLLFFLPSPFFEFFPPPELPFFFVRFLICA